MCNTTTSTYLNTFVFLARNRHYDGIVFHPVIAGFMTQAGVPPPAPDAAAPATSSLMNLLEAGEYQLGPVAQPNAGTNTNGRGFLIVTGPSKIIAPRDSLFGATPSVAGSSASASNFWATSIPEVT